MRCLDKSQDLEVWGNYNTGQAQNLRLVFERCDNATKQAGGAAQCKTEAEITAWVEDKYIALIFNEARFIQHKFGQDRVERKSSLSWYALSNNSRKQFVKLITRSKLQLGDSVFNLAGFMDENESTFSVEDVQSRVLTER